MAAPLQDQAAVLREAAAGNPELQRLLAERDMLVQRMQEIADRAPGAFAGHDRARYPVEPLGERRARDSRWAQSRDESRSDAIRRILESRRRDAAAEADRWPEVRERQRVRALDEARAEREAAEAEARALDERIEQARQRFLAERWSARAAEAGDDWHSLREQQAVEALAQARARTAQAAGREQVLERGIARDRADRPDDWSEQRERRRTRALELARRQAVEAAAAEQTLERRLARAREDRLRQNRDAQDAERPPQWVPPSDRRDPGPLPQEPGRRLPPTAAERSLDDRIARTRESGALESRPKAPRARPEEPRRAPPAQEEQHCPRARPERYDRDARFLARHHDRVRSRPLTAAAPKVPQRPAPDPVKQVTRPEPAIVRPDPVVGTRPDFAVEPFDGRREREREARAAAKGEARKRGGLPQDPGRRLREFGTAGQARRPVGPERPPQADRAEQRLRSGRDSLRDWEQRRERTKLRPDAGLGDLGGLHPLGERSRGRRSGPAGQLASLGDKQRDPWPEKQTDRETGEKVTKEKDRERPGKAHGPAERVQDLDKARERALERLKARREGERRDERRRALGLERLAAARAAAGR